MSAPIPSAGEPYTATWRQLAACRGMDVALWFPKVGVSRLETAATRAICEGCPVKAACLQDAFDTDERFGMRGGLFPKERQALRRTAAAA